MDKEDRKAQVLKLWEEGLSQGQIVRALPGLELTRATVAGIVYRGGKSRCPGTGRLGGLEQGRGLRWRVQGNIAPIKRTTPAPKKEAAPAPVPIEDEPKPVGELGEWAPKGGCEYIAGDVNSDFQMCGHPVRPGKKYCDWHIDNKVKRPDLRTIEGKAYKARIGSGMKVG